MASTHACASRLTARRAGSLNGKVLRARATGGARARRACEARAEIKEIFMPALSSTMTEGKIVSWLMGEGDAIGKGDAVVVVEKIGRASCRERV